MKNRKKIVLVLLIMCVLSINAQPVSDIAFYPLIEDLVDETGRNDDVFLQGNFVLPTMPEKGTELCQNGIYIISEDGQNIQTPKLNNMDITNFEFEVDIKPLASVPNSNPFGFSAVLIAGKFGRWIGISINDSDQIGLKYNNSNTIFSTVSISVNDVFHTIKVKYYNGSTQLYVDGILALDEALPALEPFQNDHEFTTTDFQNGQPFHGCIRNLRVKSNDVIFKGGLEPVM